MAHGGFHDIFAGSPCTCESALSCALDQVLQVLQVVFSDGNGCKADQDYELGLKGRETRPASRAGRRKRAWQSTQRKGQKPNQDQSRSMPRRPDRRVCSLAHFGQRMAWCVSKPPANHGERGATAW